MATIEDVRAAGVAFGQKFKKNRTFLLGTLGDGNGNILGTRNNMVLVRIGGNPPTEVFNFSVPPIDNLPVLIGYDSDQPDTNNSMEVVGIDRSRISDWENFTYVPLHAHTHTYNDPDAPYRDVPLIHKRQIKPMSVWSTSPASMTVTVESDYYLFQGGVSFFGKTTSADFTPYLPTDEWAAVIVLMYIDPVTGLLGYLRGTEFERTFPPSIAEQIPPPILNSIPLAGILLYSDTTSIEEGQIYDVRLLVNPIEDLSTNPVITSNTDLLSERAWMGV